MGYHGLTWDVNSIALEMLDSVMILQNRALLKRLCSIDVIFNAFLAFSRSADMFFQTRSLLFTEIVGSLPQFKIAERNQTHQ